MSRIRSRWSVFVVWTLCFGAVVGAQIVAGSQVQRDPHGQQSNERRIPVGTSTISGTVTAEDSGAPVRGARVMLMGHATCTGIPPAAAADFTPMTRSVVSDASGQFSFPRLPAGVFKISVASIQSQYVVVTYGQRRPEGAGQSIRLADGQSITLQVPMPRGSVITGRVASPDGAPLPRVEVRALRYDRSTGFQQLETVQMTSTDDRGVYRLFGLQPGDYFVAARPDPVDDVWSVGADAAQVERAILSARVFHPPTGGKPPTVSVAAVSNASNELVVPPACLPTYAPDSPTVAGATVITVAGSEERAGVDIRARMIPASIIQGVVSTPLDPGVSVQLWLLDDDPLTDGPPNTMTRPDQNGAFMFHEVAPGTYTVFAQTVVVPSYSHFNGGPTSTPPPPPPQLTDAQKMWGKARVTVAGGPIVQMSIALQPSRSISGIVVFDTPQRPDLARARVTVVAGVAESARPIYFPAGSPQALVGPDGRFTITGVPAGRYILRLNGSVRLKSSVVAGQDTLDFPIEFTGDRDVTDAVLTASDRTAELTGTLTDASGRPALDFVVIVAATDSRYWGPGSRRVVMTELDPGGRYGFDSLPPGSYQISVVVDPEPGALFDAAFLRAIARTSVPVTIADGGKVTQHLRVK